MWRTAIRIAACLLITMVVATPGLAAVCAANCVHASASPAAGPEPTDGPADTAVVADHEHHHHVAAPVNTADTHVPALQSASTCPHSAPVALAPGSPCVTMVGVTAVAPATKVPLVQPGEVSLDIEPAPLPATAHATRVVRDSGTTANRQPARVVRFSTVLRI